MTPRFRRSVVCEVTAWTLVILMVCSGLEIRGIRVMADRAAPSPGVDQLGPDNGESIAAYARSAEVSLMSLHGEDDVRVALATFTSALPAREVWQLVGAHARLNELVLNVPLPRVHTRIETVGTPQNAQAVIDTPAIVARQWLRDGGLSPANAVAAHLMLRQCPSVIGAVVTAKAGVLKSLADDARVRFVQVVPADSTRVSVRPITPSQTVRYIPGADDGPVPVIDSGCNP